MGVYLALMWASLRSQMSYRRSFVLELFGRFWITLVELVAVAALMARAGELAGFGAAEVVYLYGISMLSLGLGEALTDGANEMPELVRTGSFDGLLVRPASTLVQVLGRRCRLELVGRMLQGGLAVGWALWTLGFDGRAEQWVMLGVNVLASALVYAGIFVCEAATCIFTVQSSELFNSFTYGGQELTKYPLPIYDRWLRTLFLWVVPVGFTSYFPALVVLDRPDVLGLPPFLPWLAPGVALLFALLAARYWAFAVDRYRSTGS